VKIVIDPGHGGEDSGAIANDCYYKEKDIVVTYGNFLKDMLENSSGYNSYVTRADDRFVSLEGRTDMANHIRADAFVSIHCNSCQEPNTAHGFEVFHYPGATSARRLAEEIHQAWKEQHNISYTRGVKPAEFYVLRKTHMPAVLIELGFINNDSDLEDMLNIFWMEKALDAINVGLWTWEEII
jgi:N-acetylmuramoyl-L-alanine amidase